MKLVILLKRSLYRIVLPLALALAVVLSAAAQQDELQLTFSRDFGYASGTGDIQGMFSMKVSGPPDLVKVIFLIDGEPIGEDTEPPFRIQFNTDNYALGSHTLSAVGYTTDGKELRSREYQRNFVSAEESWKAGMRIVGPLMALVLGITVLSIVLPLLLGRGKSKTIPLGAPRNYGLAGGAICPRCHRPFAMNLLGINLLTGRLDRCPHCGKWSVVRRASPAELKTAELAELEMGAASAQVQGQTEEEKLRKALDESRFQDY